MVRPPSPRSERRRRGSVRLVFAELLRRQGVREELALRSSVGFLALHGGLEPGTERMAEEAARLAAASLYLVVQPRDLAWHLPSHRIDPRAAPELRRFLDHVDVVISVHGYFRPEQVDAVFVGGRDRRLAAEIAGRLRAEIAEMPVVDDLETIPKTMRGVHPHNPVNRGRGGGVQLELPHRARTGGAAEDWSPVAARLTAALATFAADWAAQAA